MLDSLKASFWPMGQPAAQEPNVEENDARNRLGELMGQLDAGIAQSTAREGVKAKAAPGALQRENDPRPQAPEPVLQVVHNELVAPQPQESPSLEDDTADEAFRDALRFIVDQRKAAEALLLEVCVLEDQLKDEVEIVNAVRECSAAKKESDRAAAEAEQAMVSALQRFDVRNALQAEREQLEELLTAKRAEAEAANAKIEELERALHEAKSAAGQIASAVASHEARAKECVDKECAAQAEEANAVERMQACNASRDAAQATAASAQQRVEALKQTVSGHRSNGLEASRVLAERIAEHAKLVKRHRESLSGNTAA